MKFLLLSLLAGLAAAASNHPKCGKMPKPNLRIVGGVNTEPLEFPWQVSLNYLSDTAGYYHTCGATILNENFVLTAAHCVNRSNIVDPTKYKCVLGEHDRTVHEGTEVEIMVKAIYVSPLWNAQKIDGDAALLHLARPIDFNGAEKHLLPACIPDYEDPTLMDGKQVVSTGWGNTQWQGTSPAILQKVVLNVVPQAKCKSVYTFVTTINDRMLCYGENGKGTCQGDSGGPLNYWNENENRWYNYGATSFGVKCAGPTYPSVTARIPYFTEWIWKTVDQYQ